MPTSQADITENDYRAIIDGLEEDVDLGPADYDDEAGLLGVFQVSISRDRIPTWAPPAWLTTSTLQINSDDEEYEDGEEEDEEDDDGSQEEHPGPAGAPAG